MTPQHLQVVPNSTADVNDPVLEQAERAIVGAVILSPQIIADLATDGLRPDHFQHRQLRVTFAAMLRLFDAGRHVDHLTVIADLEQAGELTSAGGATTVEGWAAEVPNPAGWREYGRIVRERAVWRHRATAIDRMRAAVAARDDLAFGEAEQLIARADQVQHTTSTPEELASEFYDDLSREQTDLIPMPFRELGDLTPGDASVIAGWTSMGKSIWTAMVLEHAAKSGKVAHFYVNEMRRQDEYGRRMARHSGVPFRRIRKRHLLTKDDRSKLLEAMNTAPKVGITECAGWPVAQIARHIRINRWDICAIDLLQLVPGTVASASRVSQIDEISRTLNNTARQTGCHILMVSQLNQERNKGAKRPPPALRDIRDSGSLFNDPANVMFVHREEHPVEGDPDRFEVGTTGAVWIPKGRNDGLSGVQIVFDPNRMTFRQLSTAEQAYVP